MNSSTKHDISVKVLCLEPSSEPLITQEFAITAPYTIVYQLNIAETNPKIWPLVRGYTRLQQRNKAYFT